MKRTDYETLSMEEIVVEMEDGFLAGSQGTPVVPENGANVHIQKQGGFEDIDLTGKTTWE